VARKEPPITWGRDMIDSGTSIDSMPEILRLRFATVKRNSAYFVLPRVVECPSVSPDARPHRWNRVVEKARFKLQALNA
jgi:hypothetical protein